jgi:SAM-dependent methyltransferase
MPGRADHRRGATVFDRVAAQYERHRPAYPEELLDQVWAAAALEPGAEVLEIGCGTGQLTRSLLTRGLRVTAVEPGLHLLERARAALDGAGEVRFVAARLEDALLPRAHYAAVFCASAIHWVDPDVGWRRAAGALADAGSLTLISYFGLEDPHSAGDLEAMHAVLAAVAPELAAQWPKYRTLADTLAGIAARRANISEAWAWAGGYAVGRQYAAGLFEDVEVCAIPIAREHTAAEINSLLGTMSFWARLSPDQREAIAAENEALAERLGRPIRSSLVALALTARRRARD